MADSRQSKRSFLRGQGMLNPRPQDVQHEAFRGNEFFDADDLLQVKYEMLRLVEVDKAPINQLVDRLYRATVFGLLFWPLQAYAFFLLIQLALEDGVVSPDRRWKVWVSVLFSLPLLGMLFLTISCLYGSVFPTM